MGHCDADTPKPRLRDGGDTDAGPGHIRQDLLQRAWSPTSAKVNEG